MLDTNVISELIRHPQGKTAKRIARVGEDNVCTSIKKPLAQMRQACSTASR
jgi:tRNA(fMet)-specific endonuclease VapC